MERKKERIFKALLNATEKSFISLFSQHHEHFYYCSLIMIETATPCITAISEESLEKVLNDNYDDEIAKKKNRAEYKWSYADSPYIGFGYQDYFNEVEELFNNDVWDENIDDDEFILRVADWLEIMADVMKELDKKGIFSVNMNRSKLFINAEAQPPEDTTNVRNARNLNEDTIFSNWYEENREDYDFEDE